MQKFRPLIGLLAALAVFAVHTSTLAAQSVTTGALNGTISDDAGKPVENAQVQVRSSLTGANVGTLSRASGFFIVQGLEPNANYIVTVRAIGFAPLTRDGITITLGQTRKEDFALVKQAAQLTAVTVTAQAFDYVINTSKTGVGSTISDSALRRAPTLNRNFADFVAAVPQVSTTTGYLSGGGVNLRQNSIQIDGAQSGDLFGLGTTGQAGASANAKSIPLDAVKEYQVLLSPFDVRQGGFGGLLINAVTKTGTNTLHGSAFGYTRNQDLTRTQPYLTDFSQQQYGGTLGGRIIKDKLFFFLSGEAQEAQTPAAGAYLGGTGSVAPYVKQSDIDAVNAVLTNQYGFSDAGNGNLYQKKNPLRNFFGRLDANLPLNSRAVLRYNYASADNAVFSRGLSTVANPNFGLTSNAYLLSNKTKSTVFELFSNIKYGVYNEFFTNYSTTRDFRTVPVHFPQITVKGFARSDTTGLANLVAGTEASSQGNSLDQRTIEFTDNLTIPVGTHSFTLGGKALKYRSINLFAQNSTGNWTFSSLDSLSRGLATTYVISAPAPTDPYNGLATIRTTAYTAYAADTWQAIPTLSLNFGVRYDKPVFDNLPPYNGSVDTVYHRSTNVVAHNAQWSPRFGFNWDVTGDKKNQIRGGVGLFSGPTPFVYLSNVFGNSGLSGFSSLTCNGTAATATAPSLLVPAFNSDAIAHPPLACVAGTRPNGTAAPGGAISGPAASAAVNTVDPNFKNPKYLKASLGADHRFGNGVVATVEGLYTYSENNAFYQNLALAGFQGYGINNRPLYGTFTAAGAVPTTIGSRTQVLDVTNSSGDYTYNITGQLQKSFTSNFEAELAYTYQRARDVASITSSTAGSNYRYQRDQGTSLLSDRSVSISKYDQPHKIVAGGSYHFKTYTDLTVLYSGQSGAPFDFVYGSNGGTTGDLNADGQSQNDLMYIPRDATNRDEILFKNFNSTNADSVAASVKSAVAFDKFISDNDCLNKQRGRIMQRNSCRNPWSNRVDISVAQSLGKLGGAAFKNLQLRLDVINFTNLLNKNWGEQAFSDQNSTCGQICSATAALVHTSNLLPTGGGTSNQAARGIFTFSPTYTIYNSNNASSNYRMQLSARYSF